MIYKKIAEKQTQQSERLLAWARRRGLDLSGTLGFERRMWRVQRLGWALLALFVGSALLGAYGPQADAVEIFCRALGIYFFLLLLLRASGKRTLGEMSPFDLILLLIISEATEQALTGQQNTLLASYLAIATLVGIDLLLAQLKQVAPSVERVLDGIPLLIFADGQMLKEPLKKERVDREDILEAARLSQGLENLDQIKYAILERNGKISIVPRPKSEHPAPIP